MKKKITAIICAICAFVCAFSLTACGGGGDGWTTTGTLNKDENGNVIFDNVEIILATVVSGEDSVPFSQMIQQFNIGMKRPILLCRIKWDTKCIWIISLFSRLTRRWSFRV